MHQVHPPPDGSPDGFHHVLEALNLLAGVCRVAVIADRQVGENPFQEQVGAILFDKRSHAGRLGNRHANPPHAGIHLEVHAGGAVFCCTQRLQGGNVCRLAHREGDVIFQGGEHFLRKHGVEFQNRQLDACLA